jgi:hypothetical protein
MISLFILLQTALPTKIHYDETLTFCFFVLTAGGYIEVVKPFCDCGPLGNQAEIISSSVKQMYMYRPVCSSEKTMVHMQFEPHTTLCHFCSL